MTIKKCRRIVGLILVALRARAGAVVAFEVLAMKPNLEATFQALD
jgi:hypothetical protein